MQIYNVANKIEGSFKLKFGPVAFEVAYKCNEMSNQSFSVNLVTENSTVALQLFRISSNDDPQILRYRLKATS